MKLKQLEVFVAVADYKNFSKAANALYLTQPTVSAHISALERELDASLFSRSTKEVALTAQGEKLYPYAREMLMLQEKMMGLFSADAVKTVKPLVVAASTVPSQYLLPDIMQRYKERYPAEPFQIREADSARVVEEVAKHTVDIGFTGTVLENKSCGYLPFYEDELVVVAPNTEYYRSLFSQGGGIGWIRQEPMIMREEGSGTRREVEKWLEKAGMAAKTLHIIASIGNTEAIKRSVKKGIGITIISRLAVQEEISAGTLLTAPLGEGGNSRMLNVVYNRKHPCTKGAKHLIQVVKELYL